MAKFLIIGSNSFSGSNFINKILSNKNNKIVGISRSIENRIFLPYLENKNLNNFKFYKLNLNKNFTQIIRIIKKFKPNYVANFAAQGMVNESWITPEDWYQTNIVSNTNLINNLKKYKFLKKYLHVSTPEVYGDTRYKIKENLNFAPSTPYANSRAAFDNHLMLFNKVFNFPVVISRAANIYGPGQKLYRIIPKSIINFKKNKKIVVDGMGKSLRAFVYIDDLTEAYYRILLHGKPGNTYHVSSNEFYSIKNIVTKISTQIKNSKKLIVLVKNDRLGKDHRYFLNSDKARNELNWIPKVNITDGIIKTKEWIELNFKKLNKISTKYIHNK